MRPTTKGKGPTYRSLRQSLRYILFFLIEDNQTIEEEDNQSTLGAQFPYTSQLSHFTYQNIKKTQEIIIIN
jgi:hypothetical protein